MWSTASEAASLLMVLVASAVYGAILRRARLSQAADLTCACFWYLSLIVAMGAAAAEAGSQVRLVALGMCLLVGGGTGLAVAGYDRGSKLATVDRRAVITATVALWAVHGSVAYWPDFTGSFAPSSQWLLPFGALMVLAALEHLYSAAANPPHPPSDGAVFAVLLSVTAPLTAEIPLRILGASWGSQVHAALVISAAVGLPPVLMGGLLTLSGVRAGNRRATMLAAGCLSAGVVGGILAPWWAHELLEPWVFGSLLVFAGFCAIGGIVVLSQHCRG
jgi:hypothetical protein